MSADAFRKSKGRYPDPDNAERDRQIAAARAAGEFLDDIGRKHGISGSRVAAIVARLSAPPRVDPRIAQTQKMAELYSMGVPTKQIAARFGVKPCVVNMRMHRAGIKAVPRPVWDRLAERIEFASGCWLWRGKRDKFGYGVFQPPEGSGRTSRAHRLTYEELIGPIPAGMVLDHLCRTPQCVNPWHLDPTSILENLQRGLPGGRRLGSKNKKKKK